MEQMMKKSPIIYSANQDITRRINHNNTIPFEVLYASDAVAGPSQLQEISHSSANILWSVILMKLYGALKVK